MNNTELNQSDRCLYFSCPEKTGSPALYILLYVSSAAVVLLTVCGNLLIVISVFHFKLLHTPTNMLVLSLAATDFLVGALLLPPMLIWIIESCWIFSTGFCTTNVVANIFLVCLSIYHIVLIAVDRYFALSNPFHYKIFMSLKKMQVLILSQWCVWLCYSATFLYFNDIFDVITICPGECLIILKQVSVIIDLLLSIIFPCTVIVILYTGVFIIAKRHATAIREINNLTRSQTHTNSISSERKAAKVLGILVSVFLTCMLPFFIYGLLVNFTDLKFGSLFIFRIVFSLNSTINPIIYALFYPWFRRSVKIIITLKIFQSGSSIMNILS